jgi:hypothetical protein
MTAETIIALCFSGVMMIISMITFILSSGRNKKVDITADVQLKSDVRYIKDSIDEMKIDSRAMSKNIGLIDTRLAVCEERLAQHLLTHPPNLMHARRTNPKTEGE